MAELSLDERLNLVKQVGEEIITEEELKKLLSEKKQLIAYDGFEPSGKIHIAQAVLRSININKMAKAGVKFKMFVADWHAWANNKMGGDLEKIKTVGKYFIEVWKACGMDLNNVEFIWASDLVKDDNYWKIVMQVARGATVKRIIRCGQIMGRADDEVMQASQILYPCMQCADIFYLKADICQLGMDQRKVNVLAREIGESLGFWKPVIVSHHMLMGLLPPSSGLDDAKDAKDKAIEMKMSKSKPDSAIFMTDTEEEIKRKMAGAYCPAKQVHENPVLEYCKYILFEKFNELKVERPEKFGGNVTFKSYAELEKAFAEGKLHPADLKGMAAKYVNLVVEPVRKHFEADKKASELKRLVESFKVTR
ncbi:tyrosine--tRNA ligase [Candidatus Woesearchaeota archaeon]|nr:tyrosine--tRNA ligase [Candidatus Woesearchaeota archaeon]